jgi:hypothetical protein
MADELPSVATVHDEAVEACSDLIFLYRIFVADELGGLIHVEELQSMRWT